MKTNQAPYRYNFSLNHDILNASMSISYKLGRLSSLNLFSPSSPSIAEGVKYALLLDGEEISPSQMRGLNRGEPSGNAKADALRSLYLGLSKDDPYDIAILRGFEKAFYPDGVPSRMTSMAEGFPYELPEPAKTEKALKRLFTFASNGKSTISPLFLGALFYFEMNAIRPYSKGSLTASCYLLKSFLGCYSKALLSAPIEKAIYFNQAKLSSAMEESAKSKDSAPYVATLLSLLEGCIDSLTRFAQKAEGSENVLVDKLLSKMQDGIYYSAVELLSLLGLKSRLGLQKNYLRPALARKKIKMLNPLCPTDRGQRYAKKECE